MSIQTQIERISGEVVTQHNLIDEILAGLKGKATLGEESGESTMPTQEKSIVITENGTSSVSPDDGYTLSRVDVMVDVPIPDGYISPSGTLTISQNGEHNVREYDKVSVEVESSGGVTVEGIPEGYAKVDFIRFTGDQIVDSDIVCDQDTKIRVIFTRDSETASYLYGVSSTNNVASVTAYLSNNGTWRFGAKGISRPHSVNEDIVRNAIVSKTGITHETGTATISGVSDFVAVGSLLIGSCRDADGTLPSTSGVKYTGKIFLFEMWSGDEHILKLIPVVSAAGVYRFWDVIGETFYDSITDVALTGGNL